MMKKWTDFDKFYHENLPLMKTTKTFPVKCRLFVFSTKTRFWVATKLLPIGFIFQSPASFDFIPSAFVSKDKRSETNA